MLRKLILFFVCMLLLTGIKAQWHQLPDVSCYYQGNYAYPPNYVVSDNNVVFRTEWGIASPSSGNVISICRSTDDDASSALFMSQGNNGPSSPILGSAVCMNDTTLACLILNGGVPGAYVYTSNNTLNSSLSIGGTYIWSMAATEHFVYAIHPIPYWSFEWKRMTNGVSTTVPFSYPQMVLQPSPGLSFSNDSTGFLFSSDSSGAHFILRTNDYGDHWTQVCNSSALISDLKFSGATGLAVGSGGTIYKSIDNGFSWTALSGFTSTNLTSVAVSAPGICYAGDEHGNLFKSYDNGATWNTDASGADTTITWIKITNDLSGYFQSNHQLFKQDNVTGIQAAAPNSELILYPNPTSCKAMIDLKDRSVTSVCLYDVLGNPLKQFSNNQIDLMEFSSGVYFVEIILNDQTVIKRKIIKKEE